MKLRRKQPMSRALFVIAILWMSVILPLSAVAAPYAAVVMDARNGKILHSQNSETRLHPASLTKMMTLYVAFEAIQHGEISLDTQVTISQHAASEPPSKLGLRAGQRIALRYLIRGAAVKSANDAATAIAEAISGSEANFAARMNRTARSMGMRRTTFVNAHGLTQGGHLSTAMDMTVLGRHLFYDYPQYYNLFSRLQANAGVKTVKHTNRKLLQSYRGADGIKTGYTRAAGFNLVASAERGNERIIVTVFGGKTAASRNQRVAELLDYGFQKAPRRAAVRRPQKPAYAGRGGGASPKKTRRDKRRKRSREKQLTESGRQSSNTSSRKPVTAVAKSLRPRVRQVVVAAAAPQVAVVESATHIDKALKEASMNAAVETAVEEAAKAPVPATPVPAIKPEARPEDITLAAVEPELQAEPTAPRIKPRARPANLAVAQAVPEQATPEQVAATEKTATEQATTEQPAPEAEAQATANAEAAQPTSTEGTQKPEIAKVRPVARKAEQAVKKSAAAAPLTPPPAPKPAEEPQEQLEVVTRVSTSSRRHWGINIGRYPSQASASRILLKTALSEPSTLGESSRKVIRRSDGFDANFSGMTRETADLACRRLQAKQVPCFMIGPG